MRRSYLLLALGLAACGSDKKTTTVTNPGNGNQPVVTPGSTDPNGGGTTTPTVNPNDSTKTYTGPTIVRTGRMLASGNNWQFNWAGTSFTARPAAASVAIAITVPNSTVTSSQYLDVYIDGALQAEPVKLASTTPSYSVALPDTNPHIVTWVLRTEANYGTGVMTFNGITPTGGELKPTETPAAAPRQIEFIGDSITNGYGARSLLHTPVLGRDNGCTVSGDYNGYIQDSSTESASLSYATLTAKFFKADYHLIASSGRGVFRNGATTADPNGLGTPNMSALWPNALHPYSSNISGNTVTGTAWDANGWAPQAVVINLGTNDFARHGVSTSDPNAELYPLDVNGFTTAYGNLLNAVHTKYPAAKIIPIVGPMLSNANKARATTAINAAIANVDATNAFVTTLVDVGTQPVDTTTDTGCEYHPLPTEHANVSQTLVSAISTALSWQ